MVREEARLGMEHELDSMLPEAFPVPGFVERWAHRGVPTWTRGYGEWDLYDPPEETALQPILGWSDEERELVLAAYNARWGRFLEDGEEYTIVWPPEGTLATEGYVHEGELEQCSEHGDESELDCDECKTLGQAPDTIEPAVWKWWITAETWAPAGAGSVSLEDRDQLQIMTTRMDPRDVEYHEGGPLR